MSRETVFTTRSPAETRRLGRCLGELLQPGDVVLLAGPVGAGKTTFCQGVAAGLGVTADVTSPTFVLAAEYEGRIRLIHMDLYRFAAAEEGAPQAAGGALSLEEALEAAGWEGGLEDAAWLVEWPGDAGEAFSDVLQVRIQPAPLPRIDERTFHTRPTGPRGRDRLDEWVKRWLF
ncbi:MAG: tRNA (adenosine(37)-N6)-threonylcarbamoyltransferase complex ATPase subunit type 1 TsaE [Thermoflavifilum sp.]|nr:tRNA (adenosine(37)-N6)-threonylcarbamoyltransferase complex ATPase subunit type 1 TsaE [Thermoflavifilum sp.]MCL6513678.1 tRNA (adenosine(37)-N6)-threonylcarbamoyltransferase complex ATPase subunit type 1 TsaE [Alicyclobacillus sp.]